MKTYRLHCELFAPVPIEAAFAVFENPHNLARITPPGLGFRVLTPNLEMRAGAEIDYTIRRLGLPMRWKTLITGYDPPHGFTDEQAKGPYTIWRHRHSFEAVDGGTRVIDDVEYVLPLGVLGQVAHAVMIERQLRGIFQFRQRALTALIGGVRERYRASAVRIDG